MLAANKEERLIRRGCRAASRDDGVYDAIDRVGARLDDVLINRLWRFQLRRKCTHLVLKRQVVG